MSAPCAAVIAGSIGRPSATVSFVEAGSHDDDNVTLTTPALAGDLIFLASVDRAFSYTIPSLAAGWTDLIAIPLGGSMGLRVAYQVVTAGGMTNSGTFTNGFSRVAYAYYRNARGTWLLGTPTSAIADTSVNATYAAVTPAANEWVFSINVNAGSFSWPALAAGTTPTSRMNDASGDPRVRIYDSNGVASTWPGQTSNVGFTAWYSIAVGFQAGA